MTLTDKPTIPSQVMARRVGDETVILDLAGGSYYGLDAIGTRVWQLIGEGKTLGEICDTLSGQYDVPRDVLARDILELAEKLRGQDLITL